MPIKLSWHKRCPSTQFNALLHILIHKAPRTRLLYFFLALLEFWTQGLYLEPLHQPFFAKAFFKLGLWEQLAWTGFEPWSSWSLSLARIRGVSHWCPVTQLLFKLALPPFSPPSLPSFSWSGAQSQGHVHAKCKKNMCLPLSLSQSPEQFLFFFCLDFVVLGMEPRTLYMLSWAELLTQPTPNFFNHK
jgi:hypothetical protein